MTATEFPKKRGRKPKPPEERFHQLTIRLSPQGMGSLQLMADLLGGSLSHALEYCICETASRLPESDRAAVESIRAARIRAARPKP